MLKIHKYNVMTMVTNPNSRMQESNKGHRLLTGCLLVPYASVTI